MKNKSNRFVFSKNSIAEDFTIYPGECIHYVNNGQWSIHELLAYLLEITGKADVKVTSFSLSETAIRSFVNLQETGLIGKLECLFDLSTKKNKLDLLMFAGNVVNKVYLASNHAKLISISSGSSTIIINCSANLTVNRRFEAGVIVTNQELALEYLKSINEIFANAILLNTDYET